MKYPLPLAIFLLTTNTLVAQKVQSYNDDHGRVQLCGRFPLKTLQTDSIFSRWFHKNYDQFNIPKREYAWVAGLKNITVDIYMGTWCGDSKKWVPHFVKMWEQLGLNGRQLKFIALYGSGSEGKYKQGPKGEEKGKSIHRVPTFIFRQKGKEIARIVDSPVNDLITDVAQIALGYPSQPNYRAATYIMGLLSKKIGEEIKKNKQLYFNEIRNWVRQPDELNTLGRVYLDAGRMDDALLVFELNTNLFKYTPSVYSSYAKALATIGKTKEAISYYNRVLSLDKENKNAMEQIEKLTTR